MSRKTKLLCDTNQMAYGSSSALLAILEHLDSENTAFVWGVTSEILTTDKNIHHTINADNKDNEFVRKFINNEYFDAVLVVSNLSNISTYLDKNLPVFYVDLHHWYPSEKKHRVWTDAKKCFIEKFFVENKQIPANAIEVGPLIKTENIHHEKEKLILVNIGGGENRWIKPGQNSNYMSLIIDLLKDVFYEFADYKIFVAAGKKSVASLNNEIPQNIIIKTFPQNEYLKLLSNAEYLFTSPGLNAVFEGMYYGSKLIFLPPQNASQILQLKYYEEAELLKRGLNLTEFSNNFQSLQDINLNEKKLTQEVLNALNKIENNETIKKRVANHIREQIDNVNTSNYTTKIRILLDNFGKSGAKIIANQISKWFKNEKDN